MDSFDVCWLNEAKLIFTRIMGDFLIMYCYLVISPRKYTNATEYRLWNILLIRGISGFSALLIQSAYNATRNCKIVPANGIYMVAINEIFWIFWESSPVASGAAYSYFKAETIISRPSLRKKARWLMLALFLAFAGCRINIGILRARYQVTFNTELYNAHSYSYTVTVISDVIVLLLLLMNGKKLASNSNNTLRIKMVKYFILGSLPRVLVMMLILLVLSILGFFNVQDPGTLKTVYDVFSMLKGAISTVLLLDMLLSKQVIRHQLETASPTLPIHANTLYHQKTSGDASSFT